MRFAWLKKKAEKDISDDTGLINRLTLFVYNLVWWLPIVLTLTGTIDHWSGFIGFTIITVVRLIANLYRNNVLTLEQATTFPFRSP